MDILTIHIKHKVATAGSQPFAVSDNTSYAVRFVFSPEWDAYSEKTARFRISGEYIDVPFSGNTVQAPAIPANAEYMEIGVYAGFLETSTPAKIQIKKSILADGGTEWVPAEPSVMPYIAELAEDDEITVNDVSAGLKGKATIAQIVALAEADDAVEPYDDTPEMNSGNGAAGEAEKYARGDHVHPTDTSRASQADFSELQVDFGNLGTEVVQIGEVVSAMTNTVGTLDTEAVRVSAQTLTAAQQTQARANIGAASAADLTALGVSVSNNGDDIATAQDDITALQTAVSGKVATEQGTANAGKFLVVGSDGNVTLVTLATWEGGSY